MVQWSLRMLIREQLAHLKPVLRADLKGKSVIVVGANTGIGLETAKHFARMKPSRLILGCRNEQKGLHAVAAIEKATGYRSELRLVDLADFSSVINFASQLGEEPVDILVANAGIAKEKYVSSKDGWEEMLQVNHLSSALLSFLLLPNMRKAAIEHSSLSRMVIVASDIHHAVTFQEDAFAGPGLLQNLNDKEACTREVIRRRYYDTKLLNILFTRAFAEKLAPSNQVIATSANPGFCKSELLRDARGADWIRFKFMELTLARTTEQSSRQLIRAALGPDGQEGPHTRYLNGAYINCDSVTECSDFVISKEGYAAQEKIWAETIEVLSKVSPVVGDITRGTSGQA